MREAAKIAAAVAVIALLAADLGTLAVEMLGESARTASATRQASPKPAQPEYRPPVTEGGQAVERHSDRGTREDQEPRPDTGWPRSIEAGEEASRADCGKPEECRSEQREYSDLRAQWKAADAAEGQRYLAWWQTILAGIATGIAGLGTVFVVRTLEETRRGAAAALKAAEAAMEANRLSREAHVLDQRPWLKVKAKFENPLTWNDNGANFSFSFLIENTGQTPALNTWIDIDIILEFGKGQFEVEQEELADQAMRQGRIRGYTVFPNDKDIMHHGIGISMERCLAATKNMGSRSDWMLPFLIGTVTYHSTFDDRCYQTGFIYHIVRIVNGRPNVAIGPSEGNIPVKDLALMEWDRPGRVT